MTRQAANQLSQHPQLTASAADASTVVSAAVSTGRSSPLARYLEQVQLQQIVDDGAQHQAIKELERLHQQLTQMPKAPQVGDDANLVCQGLYMWGDVGRGKTYLMDLFYQCLESESNVPALRLHFHRFMARIHKELIGESGNRDPLKRIAKRVAQECRVLCFDEFFVSDIGDAMILAKLFEALFEQGIILVATSNIPIDELYKNGLQRQRFLPTIDLLNRFTQELHLSGEQDHRLHSLNSQVSKQRYFVSDFSISNDTFSQFEQIFETCADTQIDSEAGSIKQPLLVHNRVIDTVKYTVNVAWFEFDALCDGPRSQLDYIEIASRFSTLILTHVPVLGGEPRSWIKARGTEDGAHSLESATSETAAMENAAFETAAFETGNRQLSYAVSDDPARRFISLVDELYDQGVELYIQAEVPMDELYSGALSFEFRRTLSRLTQMQSLQY
ncbi:cell division protein ZapE [uncultured Shewanella sp.]|uniref:cell division protein ZapE n=1 Tax=uncultured Shewanella sp. TaxID=173975 RepID=UPI002604653A|nr:cell division protein ZapE [uncultured Shewanella sp.]